MIACGALAGWDMRLGYERFYALHNVASTQALQSPGSAADLGLRRQFVTGPIDLFPAFHNTLAWPSKGIFLEFVHGVLE